MATQGLGWALFTAALVSLLWLAVQVATGVALRLVAEIRSWILATGLTMFAAQVVGCALTRLFVPFFPGRLDPEELKPISGWYVVSVSNK